MGRTAATRKGQDADQGTDKGDILPYLSGMTVETTTKAMGETRDGGTIAAPRRVV